MEGEGPGWLAGKRVERGADGGGVGKGART